MRNIKNTATTIALAAVLMVGTASANAEVLTSESAQPNPTQCTVEDTNVIEGFLEHLIKEILGNPRIFYMREFVTDASTCSGITPNGYRSR